MRTPIKNFDFLLFVLFLFLIIGLKSCQEVGAQEATSSITTQKSQVPVAESDTIMVVLKKIYKKTKLIENQVLTDALIKEGMEYDEIDPKTTLLKIKTINSDIEKLLKEF